MHQTKPKQAHKQKKNKQTSKPASIHTNKQARKKKPIKPSIHQTTHKQTSKPASMANKHTSKKKKTSKPLIHQHTPKQANK